MARLLVLTDRRPDDPDWKGAYAWDVILSLAESQHEVLAVTPFAPETIPCTHSRLRVAQPIRSWRADQLPRLLQTIMGFQPEGIHTFALRPDRHWARLTLWPWLNEASVLFPRAPRWSTLFEARDWDDGFAFYRWMAEGDGVTVFHESERLRIRETHSRPIQVSPIEFHFNVEANPTSNPRMGFIPSAVSEWAHPHQGLSLLLQYLLNFADREVQILGGWGEWSSVERKKGWSLLHQVADRIHMIDPVAFAEFLNLVQASGFLWLQSLAPTSWRYRVSQEVGNQLGKEIISSPFPQESWHEGSTSNFLSRLYAGRGSF